MTYTINTTNPIVKQPLGRNTPKFTKNIDGLSGHFFVSASNNQKQIKYKMNEEPYNHSNHWETPEEGPVEINDPDPEPHIHTDYPIDEENLSSTSNIKVSYRLKSKKKLGYNLAHNIDDIDERGVIEIPATNDTVIYQDEDGQYYEVPVSDLIDYDGEDGEITYHSKTKKKYKINKLYLNAIIQQQRMTRQYQ